ncbi:hypothetical protein UFOVP1346_54 [uncultured Caudovirales phage]|uniref:Uncharacterized protein n=1 Tax=uncultured Caudovirales phage TaxID=2100421 RepID=A0A6J5R1B1_9CAUD|nr:hypothetical protein UFOVP921_34 [uncultured Caudovirales phage]CAB4187278.1 hypothetical protein UFOVP1156_10 [uncultured Caudovirales phage]CAB4200656.1 hypothetical protein UFOVP1346_54 [uncultured Caudovirales phage]
MTEEYAAKVTTSEHGNYTWYRVELQDCYGLTQWGHATNLQTAFAQAVKGLVSSRQEVEV